jgi:hypothetical protein
LRWQLIDDGCGFFRIKCKSSGKVLNSTGVAADGIVVQQWSDVSSDNLRWYIIQVN